MLNKVKSARGGKTISVIGSGLGGLSASIRLAHNGHDVTVYEQNSAPGGKARSLEVNGFRFDTGPSLLTMPFIIKELFSSVNEDISGYLSIKKLDNLCRYFYSDGTALDAFADKEKFAEEIGSKTSERKEHLYRYLNYCKKIYDLTADIFLFNNLYDISTYTNSKALKTLLKIGKIDSFRTMNEANRSFFKDEKVIQLFNRYATYNGSNPYQCPATLNIISHVEYNIGGYYIEGGMYKLTEALYSLALKKGVKFCFGSKVNRIIAEQKKVKGIDVSGEFIKSDCVISNSDVYNTYSKLLSDTKTKAAKKYGTLEPSSSALVYYWGVDTNSEKLDVHNILFSSDYKNEFDELFKKKIYPTDPTVYIYISSKFAKGNAPQNMENWFVMINAPYVNDNLHKPGNKLRETILDKIKKFTGFDIRDKIISEAIMTPYDIESHTGSFKGSIYGISSNNRKAAFMRQPNRSKQYGGLYFCGGSAHPGGGIPLVILSGKLCADMILSGK
jgi:phytoene desaturase